MDRRRRLLADRHHVQRRLPHRHRRQRLRRLRPARRQEGAQRDVTVPRQPRRFRHPLPYHVRAECARRQVHRVLGGRPRALQARQLRRAAFRHGVRTQPDRRQRREVRTARASICGNKCGNRRKVAVGSASLLGSGGVVSPPTGCGAGPREPSTFPTKNSSNERRKRVERRTMAYRKWVSYFIGKKVGGGGGGASPPPPPPRSEKWRGGASRNNSHNNNIIACTQRTRASIFHINKGLRTALAHSTMIMQIKTTVHSSNIR